MSQAHSDAPEAGSSAGGDIASAWPLLTVDGVLRRLLQASVGCMLDCGAVAGDGAGEEARAPLLLLGKGGSGGGGGAVWTAPSTRVSSSDDGSEDGSGSGNDDDDGDEEDAWADVAIDDVTSPSHAVPHSRRPYVAACDGIDSPTRLLSLPLPAAATPRRRRYGDAAAKVATTLPTHNNSSNSSSKHKGGGQRGLVEYATLLDFDPNQLDFLLH